MKQVKSFESAIREWIVEDFPLNILSVVFPHIHKFIRGVKLIPGESVPLRMEKYTLVFSSGTTAYFLPDEQCRDEIEWVAQLFSDKPDTCARYGSLLVSQCRTAETIENLKIKVVDFENPSDAHWRTDDCRGFVSRRVAELVDAKADRPFQFRLIWMEGWLNGANFLQANSPGKSFIAKGTLAPVEGLKDGFDLVLDKSSVKGNDIPCGEYFLPRVALGNKANASIAEYSNSWQFNIWWSKEAIAKDIVPGAIREAERLIELQKDQSGLLEEMLLKAKENADKLGVPIDRIAQVVESDRYGRLHTHRKILSWGLKQLQKRWKKLAYGGAHRHLSGMAQPCRGLGADEIACPELPEGEYIVTRYPIVNSDCIRKYRNVRHKECWLSGTVYIHPDVAMANHQCDFDGDVLALSPVEQLPAIAQEVLWGSEPPRNPPVTKQEKVPYQGSLEEIVNAQASDSIGLCATWIGIVECSKLPQRQQLLEALYDGLQIEVDSPKSQLRFGDVYPDLEDRCNAWNKAHPVSLFDLKKDKEAFLSYPGYFPEEQAEYHQLAIAMSDGWEQVTPYVSPISHWRYLFPKERNDHWEAWSLRMLDTYHEGLRAIASKYKEVPSRLSEAIGAFIEKLRRDCPVDEHDRFLACTALWQLQHNPQLSEGAKGSRQVFGGDCHSASLVFHLFSDVICDRVEQNLPRFWITGKDKASYAGFKFSNHYARLEVRGNDLWIGKSKLGGFPDQCKGDKIGSNRELFAVLNSYRESKTTVEIKVVEWLSPVG